MAGSTMKCSVVRRTRSSSLQQLQDAQRVRVGAHRPRTPAGAAPPAGPGRCAARPRPQRDGLRAAARCSGPCSSCTRCVSLTRGQEAEGEIDAARCPAPSAMSPRGQRRGLDAHAGRALGAAPPSGRAGNGPRRCRSCGCGRSCATAAGRTAPTRSAPAPAWPARCAPRRRQALGLRRGLHAAAGAHEQRVLDQQAQPRQALAGGRLRQVQQSRRRG